MAQNFGYGPNAEINKRLAGMTGYTGDFGTGDVNNSFQGYMGKNGHMMTPEIQKLMSSRVANPGLVGGAMATPTTQFSASPSAPPSNVVSGGQAPQSTAPSVGQPAQQVHGPQPVTGGDGRQSYAAPTPVAQRNLAPETPYNPTASADERSAAALAAANAFGATLGTKPATQTNLLAGQIAPSQPPAGGQRQLYAQDVGMPDRQVLQSGLIGGAQGPYLTTDDVSGWGGVPGINAPTGAIGAQPPAFVAAKIQAQNNGFNPEDYQKTFGNMDDATRTSMADHVLKDQPQFADLPIEQRQHIAAQQIANQQRAAVLATANYSLAHGDVQSKDQILQSIYNIQGGP